MLLSNSRQGLLGFVAALGLLAFPGSGPAQVPIPEDATFTNKGAAGGSWGSSLAVEGDVAIVGAPVGFGTAAGTGAVYAWRFIDGAWHEEQRLAPSNLMKGDRFGAAVAISEGMVLIGAPDKQEQGGGLLGGAIYTYRHDGDSWVQIQMLTAGTGEEGKQDDYGEAVALGTELAAVGAPRLDGDKADEGAVYMYRRIGFAMQPIGTLMPPAGQGGMFGSAVAVAGDLVVVGAEREDTAAVDAGAVFIYRRTGTFTFEIEQVLRPANLAQQDNFGSRLSLSGDVLAVGAKGKGTSAGALYVYRRDPVSGQWILEHNVLGSAPGDQMGSAVAVDGDWLAVGMMGKSAVGFLSGAGELYRYDGAGWQLVTPLAAPDGGGLHQFGSSAALSGGHLLVGAQGAATTKPSAGAAYAWTLDGSVTGPQKIFLGLNSQPDSLGSALAIVGNGFAVGAPGSDEGGVTDAGAVLFFEGLKTSVLAPADAQIGDGFGAALAASGDLLLVGTPQGDTVVGQDSGQATLLRRVVNENVESWVPQVELFPGDGTTGDRYGCAVGLLPGIAAVGADQHLQRGAVFTYADGGASWFYQSKLMPAVLEPGAGFGSALSMSGNVLVAGAPGHDGAATDSGGAWVYHFNGVTWVEHQALEAVDAGPNQRFGAAVAVDGTRVAVGAPGDAGAAPETGAAYVFVLTGETWQLEDKVFLADGAAGDLFGAAVALAGNRLVVGAPGRSGAHVFRRVAAQWVEEAVLVVTGGSNPAGFGSAVAAVGTTAAVGAPDAPGTSGPAGAAYSYDLVDADCATPAGSTPYGTGKEGTLGIPVLASDAPQIGQDLTLSITSARPGSSPILLAGITAAAVPYDLGTILVAPILVVAVPVAIPGNGSLDIPVSLPANGMLCGATVFVQAIIPDPQAAGLQHLAMTNGVELTFGG